MTFDVFRGETPVATKRLFTIQVADLVPTASYPITTQYQETPDTGELEAFIATINTATPNTVSADALIDYVSGAGKIITHESYSEIGTDAIKLKRDTADELTYDIGSEPAEADDRFLPPSAFMRRAADGKLTRIVVEAPNGAYVIDDSGVGGGGPADGNGLVRAVGDSIPAGELAAIGGTLWRNSNGIATPIANPYNPTTMLTDGFVNTLQAASGLTDVIAKSFVATAGQSVFVLDSTPTDPDSVELTVSGAPVQVLGVDYTLSAATVSLTAPVAALIQAGDGVRITYI